MWFVQVMLVGIAATLLADIWQRGLSITTGLPSANWAMIGRWVAGFRRGVFVHDAIWTSPEVAGELTVGWVFHYAVGVIYAAAFLAIVAWLGASAPPLLVAGLVFGLATVAVPWFVMQPALGLGIMAADASNRLALRIVTVSTHLVFGLGLYLGWLAWDAI